MLRLCSTSHSTLQFSSAALFNQDLSGWDLPADGSDVICTNFAYQASAWLDAYDGSIAGKTPPLSEDLINAGCGP